MYVKLPIIMKYPVTVAPKESIKPAIDAFLNLLISSSKDSFKADDEFGFSLEDYRFEIYDPEVGLFHDTQMKRKQDIIGSIEDPTRKHKMSGSSINTGTFAKDLSEAIAIYERRLKDVVVSMELMAHGSVLLITVNGIIDDGYDTPYTYHNKIRIW